MYPWTRQVTWKCDRGSGRKVSPKMFLLHTSYKVEFSETSRCGLPCIFPSLWVWAGVLTWFQLRECSKDGMISLSLLVILPLWQRWRDSAAITKALRQWLIKREIILSGSDFIRWALQKRVKRSETKEERDTLLLASKNQTAWCRQGYMAENGG